MRKVLLALVFLITACSDAITSPGDCERIGAIFNDGTRSTATGSGACSSHGAVKE